MICDEVRQLNKQFIRHDIEYKKLSPYIKHVQSCKDCYDELDIQFIVQKGIESLNDENSDFNLQGLLSNEIEEAKLYVKMRNIRRKLIAGVSTTAYCLLAMLIIYFLNII